ncbi:MAG: S8 family peptidase [Pseudomonadota bacterium]
MKQQSVSTLSVALLLALAGVSHADETRRAYIVQLTDKPVATYSGGIANLPATQPAAGSKLDINAATVQQYIEYLETQQDRVLGSIGEADVLARFNTVFNGFSVLLTDAQAAKLAGASGVAAVTVDEARELDTSYTTRFLGLDATGGLWEQLGGNAGAGEDIIVGIIDSGVTPENPAFSDKVDANGTPIAAHLPGTVVYGPAPARWTGSCQQGVGFTTSHCNNKLIGAQFFDASYQSTAHINKPHYLEYRSPRDQGGHGTHTASTAAGNHGVPVSVAGVSVGKTSGMAPRARIAAYKVCWTYIDTDTTKPPNTPKNSCFNGDSVAAIEKAVQDGVDVINYSISGTQTNFNDPVEQAFFAASRAGVFVATSAGNSGPGNQVAHISPWLTTVAASTHDRFHEGGIVLGNGMEYRGASLTDALPDSAMILSANAGLAGANAEEVRLCLKTGVLDPAKVSGKIVVCDRGVNARVDKSAAVKMAGGVGMVLVNNTATESLNDDPHSVPSVHLDNVKGAAVKAYVAATEAASGRLLKGEAKPGVIAAPLMAAFSSRGPNKGNANILKPDLTAPGVSILAAYAPIVTSPEMRNAIADLSLIPDATYDYLQGTSMSSPHVAGLAALLKHKHPGWSPAAIKSALMTTTYSVLPDNQPGAAQGALPWGQGAGHVNPNKAADPGLVYDLGAEDYYRFLCGANALPASGAICRNVGAVAAYNLNLPSITVADVYGKATVKRTVKNVSNVSAVYTASASVPGFTVTVSPAVLTLAPGQSASYTLSLTRTTAPMGEWAFGELRWQDGQHVVRSPITVKASALTAPANLNYSGMTGSKLFTVGTGFAGSMSTLKAGLKPATRTTATVGLAGASSYAKCLNNAAGFRSFPISVPANTAALRVALYDSYSSGQGADDLDLELYSSTGAKLATSAGASTNEAIQARAPAAGTYLACVVGYAPVGGSSTFTLFSWVVGNSEDAANWKAVAPSKVYIGGTASVALSWNVPADKYLGVLRYSDGSTVIGSSMVLIDAEPATTASKMSNNALTVSKTAAKASLLAKQEALR